MVDAAVYLVFSQLNVLRSCEQEKRPVYRNIWECYFKEHFQISINGNVACICVSRSVLLTICLNTMKKMSHPLRICVSRSVLLTFCLNTMKKMSHPMYHQVRGGAFGWVTAPQVAWG
jgi:hypothetical protein